jgi:DNA-binding transcriptional LysR family regulator
MRHGRYLTGCENGNKRPQLELIVYLSATTMDVITGMRVFTSVVDSGSFAAAADKLDLSRGMTSRYLAQVESHLGARLLNRTTRRLSLTEAGRDYYERATEVLAMVGEAERSVASGAAEPRGVLRVNTAIAFGTRHLAPTIQGYLERYPNVRMELTLNDRVVDLVEEGFDVAVRIARRIEDGLVARPIATTRLVACASPAYLKRRGTPKSPGDLVRHNCLTYAYTTLRAWRFCRGGKTEVVKVGGTLHSNNGALLAGACATGSGICLEPAFVVDDFLRAGTLVRLFPGWDTDTFTIYAVYPSRNLLPPKVRTFVDYLVERFKNGATWEKTGTGRSGDRS